MLRCAILDDYQDHALSAADWGSLKDRVEITRFDRHLGDEDAVAAALSEFEIVVAMRERTPFPATLLQRLPKLRLLVTTGMANAAIDLKAARARGIDVAGTRSSIGPAAELAWGLLLSLMREIPREIANLRAGGDQWQLSVGRDLKEKTLGVVGLGKLGSRVARYGKAFDMDVLGFTRTDAAARCAELGIGHAETLDELLERSDVVSLHLTLTAETRHIIGARELGLMKSDSVLINTSRGPLIDEAALIAALEKGQIGGAGLDVFDSEPLPADHPFRRLPNVLATPHLGYVTRDNFAIQFPEVVEDIATWLDGRPVRVLNA
ncbi:D-2-hydroxyacid dehydrogenase family protein [Chelativorans sp. ZYF759]|uniref:D-2-hydroxyacid dehydrogenase family protein n=1 Tax=Chelativorans sp. ZYF759 TaxID=2692213 RepID=UPI00145F4DEB|nr:D-2-hydroxyacid dehydrogenase family protein [Chelativorans sp. ZYF759]NMG39579.1 D-2-hydroxyacid dehydrogenase family protein [Chelativorans sp. ZYF759]